MWGEITKEYTEKGTYAQTDLRAQFLDSKLQKGVEVRHFLDGLWTKREELASVGVTIDEKDYQSTIIKSLPTSLVNFASSQLAATRLYSSTKTIDPDTLISIIIEEAEQQKARGPMHSDHCDCDKDKDEALAAASAGKPFHRGRGKHTCRGGFGAAKDASCWVCGSTEHKSPHHYLHNQQSGSNTKSKPTGKDAGAHIAAVESDDEDSVFGVSDTLSDNSDSDMPDLLSIESSDDEDGNGSISTDDWFSLTEEDPWSDNEVLEADINAVEHPTSPAHPSLDADVAMPAGSSAPTLRCMELYDSGATRHISPYRDSFETYLDITPKPFTAANKQVFSATRMGDMIVEVPNGYDVSRLCLTEVLFSCKVGYTLVLIGRLDELGFSTTFAEGFCTIHGTDGETIGRILHSTRGLYRVVWEHDTANTASEHITVMELHHCFGHITPSVAHQLATRGLVSGLIFDDSKDDGTFCESCVYGKATCKPVAKEREGEHAEHVGNVVWSDVWGPSPMPTLGGRHYYVTFTNDHLRLTYLYSLRQKSGTFDAYQAFEAWLDRQLAAKVKLLHSD